ncbi:hypothetical protein [Flagellimonas pelagia]|uniref:Outer membrane protein beta-barrel domain-containing protein n=1 Tax=Flagellimonas pelagia TaxID=2306998 RepID=A0A3A1NF72_9FLAO|nr:hypothetical protein [Allomuricauda maritima]RIV41874.1 hypothetical protein D2V05_17290 [Allomuricauda maritima]TXJ90750.1 hypothetical protein FQ017_17135 [Allomuricauda maritima]
MKITTLFAALFLFVTASLSAQEISEHALGLRLGDSDGFGAEISYQKSIGSSNRAEFDLGWRDSRDFDAFKLTGVYQWVRPLDGNFNWYYGVGGGLGSVNFDEGNGSFYGDNDGVFVFAAGDIGVEYNFDIPLLISLDFRPEIGLIGYDGFDNDFNFDIALGIRYQF